jgi:hypothetical protein
VCRFLTTAAGECTDIHRRLVVSKTVLVPHASTWRSRVSKLMHLKQQQVPGHHNSCCATAWLTKPAQEKNPILHPVSVVWE